MGDLVREHENLIDKLIIKIVKIIIFPLPCVFDSDDLQLYLYWPACPVLRNQRQHANYQEIWYDSYHNYFQRRRTGNLPFASAPSPVLGGIEISGALYDMFY